MKILLVEDDSRISGAIAEVLREQNHTVELADDGDLGWELAQDVSFDLIVLDLQLPKRDGLLLCQQLRQVGKTTPILMLTARDGRDDKIIGLDAGADDYVVKPFDLPELLARIRALLRRNTVAFATMLSWERVQLDPNTCKASYSSQPLGITPKEYALLELLLRQGSRVLSKRDIVNHLWAFEDSPGEETVKVHVRSLRKKLREAGAPANLIENVYGLGYRLNPNL